MFGGPAWWPGQGALYVQGAGDALKKLTWSATTGMLNATAQSAAVAPFPGGVPVVSARSATTTDALVRAPAMTTPAVPAKFKSQNRVPAAPMIARRTMHDGHALEYPVAAQRALRSYWRVRGTGVKQWTGGSEALPT